MKKKIAIHDRYGVKEKEIDYIPVRFIIAMLLIVLETVAVIGITILCAMYIPYFYLALWATEIFCVLRIINSDENPDYKIPWLLVTIVIPVAGLMIYFMFYDRKLTKKQIKRAQKIKEEITLLENEDVLSQLEQDDKKAHLQARLLCTLSGSHIYKNTKARYYPMGELLNTAMLEDLRAARGYIFLEYFIIEEGIFWNGILDILKEKAKNGVEVRVIYDDVGCMLTLPGDYYKTLQSYGIKAVRFSPLRGQADNEFNNRSHRKIMVIDGKIGYTGGVNIADEYINEKRLFGKWKDVGVRLEGEAVKGLVAIFLEDFELNAKTPVADFEPYLDSTHSLSDEGIVIPFGDGPKPVFERRVAKTMLMNMLGQAQSYVYMLSPYLIIDNELCTAIENAAIRGIDIKIITPHIPDKKIVFTMTQSYYKRLTEAGVRKFEYEPGFVHAKVYISDDEYGIVGTINLDYRSLVHHFENGVWFYKHNVINEIKADIEDTLSQSIEMTKDNMKDTILKRLIRSLVRIFSPML